MTSSKWNIDASHSNIDFTVRHMVVSKVRGHFTKFTADLELDLDKLENSKVSAKIDTNSIDTREEKRDGHLRSPDFFDVANHPSMDFVSTSVTKISNEKLQIHGNLTIRGTTKAVVLDTEILGRGKNPWGQDVISISATTKINRTDFGLKWNQALEAGGVLVSENVDIHLDIEAAAAQ